MRRYVDVPRNAQLQRACNVGCDVVLGSAVALIILLMENGVSRLEYFTMFKKVLVLADGDDPNQPALRRALLCVDDMGEIEVFGVVHEPLLEGYLGNKEIYEPLRSRVVRERRDHVAALARVAESWGVKASSNAVWAHPLPRAVADEVAARGIGLVVAAPAELEQRGSTVPSGLSHSTWQLVTGCPAPVLVVKSDGQAKYRNIVAAVDPFHAHAKPASLDAAILRQAKALQVSTGAALTVLHCYASLEYFGADLGLFPAQDPREGEVRREALHALCREADVPTTAARLVAGAPHLVLEKLEQSGEADLIVMGALARGRVAEFLIGSTAERVLHRSRADVLVIRSPPLR
jgi:universal stress protein E